MVKYVKKAFASPEKFETVLDATKEKTVIEPLGPLYKLQVWPAMLRPVAIAAPVLEIGPAPPKAASC